MALPTIINIPGQSIQANVQLASASDTLSADVTGVQIQLTDPNTVWDTTVGHIKQWGVQKSTDGGVTWSWGPVFQGMVADSTYWLAFGSRSKSGGMPALSMTANTLAAASGDRLRLAIVTDTNIVLGAQVTLT